MPRRYVFADESGDFVFAKGQNISRYFILCTIAMDSCDVGVDLLALRRKLIWDGAPLRDFFHATNDKQIVRDAVFECIADHKFTVQATIMEKSKAQPQVRMTRARFYKTGWYFHFKHALARYTDDHDELLITAASLGTKKGQGVFTDAVNDVVQQHLRRDQWAAHFCSSASDPCLQVVDYCTWAIQRKWERDNNRSYELIKDRITYEYNLWAHGKKHYY
jgi:hypothetical protein